MEDFIPNKLEEVFLPQSLQEVCKPFLSDKVNSFIPMNGTQEVLMDGTVVNVCFIGVYGEGDCTEEIIKKFCDKINLLAEEGAIEICCLAPIAKLDLCDVKERYEEMFLKIPKSLEEPITDEIKEAIDYLKPSFEQKRYLLLFYPASRYTRQQLNERWGGIFGEEGAVPTFSVNELK